MLSFDCLNVSDSTKNALKQHNVNFVFQPIFSRDNTVVAYEALMRPVGKSVLEYIEEMKLYDKLHELELVSFFGAAMEYKKRNYNALLSVNSFPAEAFSTVEAEEYALCFKNIEEKLIIEILEYTEEKHWTWKAKREHITNYKGIQVALDDFGTGYNDSEAVAYYEPNMIKIDRSLISNIDNDKKKQNRLLDLVNDMHDKVIVVLAEGIETKEEYDFLYNAGVDFFQGYYLGRPS